MTTAKFKSVPYTMLVIGVLLCLLLSLSACKKKPAATEPSTESTSTENTNETNPTDNTKPSDNTNPTTPTNPNNPTQPSDPTETTEGVICEHVLGDWLVEKSSTCTTEGSRYRECALCLRKVETEVIPKALHTPGEWIVDKISTCSVEGVQHQNCTQCKATLIYIALAKADHVTTTIPGYAATTENPGLTDGKKCTICKEIVVAQQVIPAIGSQGFMYIINSDNTTCTISGLGTYSDSMVIVPVSISGYKVTAIGDNAFASFGTITEIHLPNTINHIGTRAFYGCSGLTGITFQGTKEQWFTITKGNSWNGQTGNYTIRCTDGNITSGS